MPGTLVPKQKRPNGERRACLGVMEVEPFQYRTPVAMRFWRAGHCNGPEEDFGVFDRPVPSNYSTHYFACEAASPFVLDLTPHS